MRCKSEIGNVLDKPEEVITDVFVCIRCLFNRIEK